MEENKNILSLDDIYFKDAFTKTEDKLNFESDNVNIASITSKNDKFSLDKEGNLIVKSITTESINSQASFDSIYPVGSIYLTIANTNPSTLFGGVWESVKDRFLLCAGDTYQAGTTGGEASHKLTVSEMPSHTHSFGNWIDWYEKGGTTGLVGSGTGAGTTTSRGGDQPHNNMPPYLTVYAWQRIL